MKAGQVFTPTTPIDEVELFAGRHEQITKILEVVGQRGQHAILFGERGVGKTSLANVLALLWNAQAEEAVLAPRTSCTTDDNFESLWRKVFREIEMKVVEAKPGFTNEVETRRLALDRMLPDRFGPDDVRRVLTSVSDAAEIVIIDELDRLDRSVTRLLADTTKMLSDYSARTTLVFVGVADSVGELIQAHDSVERALVQIPMPRMSRDEVAELLEKGAHRLGNGFEPGARDRIVTLAQGLPHYAHLLGLYSTYQAIDNDLTAVGVPQVDAALHQALENTQQSIKGSYTVAVRSPKAESLFGVVLLACALAQTDDLGYFAAAAVREPLSQLRGKSVDIPSYARHLNDFTTDKRQHILEKTGTPKTYRYRFTNPLMQPYVLMKGIADGTLPPSLLNELEGSCD